MNIKELEKIALFLFYFFVHFFWVLIKTDSKNKISINFLLKEYPLFGFRC